MPESSMGSGFPLELLSDCYYLSIFSIKKTFLLLSFGEGTVNFDEGESVLMGFSVLMARGMHS